MRLTCHALQLVAECGSLFRSELDDEAATALQRYSHHDAAPLLGCFQWTVSGPGLHRRHPALPPDCRFTIPLFLIRGRPCAKARPCAETPIRELHSDSLTRCAK